MKFRQIVATFAVLVSVSAIAFAGPTQGKTIVETAVAAPNFKTLVAAVKAAGLVETLSGAGPFTVFAPTDDAFAKLESKNPGILANLLKPENKAKLASILTYHVVSGKIMKSDVAKLKSGTMVKTVNGQSFRLTKGTDIHVDKAKIIATDIVCKNGVIHVIDSVILPK